MTTKPSYERINYSLRPAKNIERKMLVEIARRLAPFGAVSHYRYLGLGSVYFADFQLFHTALGISTMISIEEDEPNRARFAFNKPYACIELMFGTANDILPELDWTQRTITWLDYDGRLDLGKLSDVGTVCSVAPAGSMLVVTVNAQPESTRDGLDRVAEFKERVGPNGLPPNVKTNEDLGGWKLADASYRLVMDRVAATLRDRNASSAPDAVISFEQVAHFHYEDGARMLTVGGVLFDEGQRSHFSSCDFTRLDFVATGADPYTIEVPKLTFKEIRHLNEQLPSANDVLESEGVPVGDLERYRRVYRYFPAFIDATGSAV